MSSTTPSSSSASVYAITYTIAASGGCASTTATTSVTIIALDNAGFNYSAVSYCSNSSNPSPIITGLAGGGFTSSPAGLVINASTGVINVSSSTAASYTVTYTTTGTCMNSSTQNIIINTAPNVSISGADNLTCTTTSVARTASGGISYSWTDGQGTSEIANINTPGTYIVTVTAANSCTATASTSVTFLNDLVISASNTGPYNEGQKIDINATGGNTYTWNGPNGFFSTLQNPSIPTAIPANAGVYNVTATGANNCTATASTVVMISCSSQGLSYYLVFTDGTPQIIAPLVSNLKVQASNRPMSVIAVTACEQPTVESVRLQLSGTTNTQFQIDNEMPFNLHDFYNVNNGDVLAPNYYTFIARGYDQDNSLGNVIVGPDVIGFDVLWIGRSITSTTPSVNEVFVGSSFSVSAVSTNHAIHPFGAGNMYEVYLSDVNGNFMSRTLIGSGSNAINISCQIPMYLPGSNKYKLMVISTNPIVASEPSVLPLSVIGYDLALKSPIDDINATTENHKSISTIKAENKLIGNAKSAYTTGKFIELKPGFSVENSGVFEARIEGGCL